MSQLAAETVTLRPLGDLIGGDSFLVNVTMRRDGIAVSLRALVDTGAQAWLLADRVFTQKIAQQWDLKRTTYDQSAIIKGFENKEIQTINSSIPANLQVQGRTFRNSPLLEVDLGGRRDFQVIIGLRFLAANRIKLDCATKKLLFPRSMPYSNSWQSDIPVSLEAILRRSDPKAQKAMIRRDIVWSDSDYSSDSSCQLVELAHINEVQSKGIISRPALPLIASRKSWSSDQTKSLEKMKRALQGTSFITSQPDAPRKSTSQRRTNFQSLGLDLCLISSDAFFRNLARPSNHRHRCLDECSFSIMALDRAIADSLDQEDEATREEILAKLPPQYAEFAQVFSKRESDELPPHRPIDMKIELLPDAPPLKTHPLYSMSTEQLVALKEYLSENLRKEWIVPSGAEYGSPVLFAKKPNGGLRLCVDYREVNRRTRRDTYPLPLIGETLERISKAKIFTKLDIRQAFNRIRIDEASEDLTTFRTRFGQFKYKVVPFGLSNGPSTFQRYINTVLFPYLDAFCTAYVDDILIFSEDPLEHELHVKQVLSKLHDAGLQVDIRKSEFSTDQTKFLGYIISTSGISVDPEKVSAVTEWEPPRKVKELQAFLGFCNFYRQFIDSFSRVAKPLHRLTAALTWEWTREHQEAFDQLKRRLTSAPVLVHFQEDRPTKLETDASDGVISGALSQLSDQNEWHPVAFFSKTMNPAEGNYPIHDKELLAIIRSLQEWEPILLSCKESFDIFTDHQALQYFATKRKLNSRQAAWSEVLAPFNFQLHYRPGKQNLVADLLSRKAQDLITQKAVQDWNRTQTLLPEDLFAGGAPHASVMAFLPDPLDTSDQTENLQGTLLIDAILAANRESSTLVVERTLASTNQKGYSLQDGLLLRSGRLVVPDEGTLRTRLCDEYHRPPSRAHPGRNKMRRMISQQYTWPGMGSYIDRYCGNCPECRRSQNPRLKPAGFLKPLPIPDRVWQHVTMDFKSFPSDQKGFDAVLVIVDRLGKRTFTLPCHKTCTAAQLAELYYFHPWRIFGTPETITSDRGPQFIADFSKELAKLTGITLQHSTPEHAETDGQSEIMNQFIQTKLRPFIDHFQDDWSILLPCLDFAHATQPHESTGLAPVQVELGYLPRMTFDWEARTRKKTTPAETLSSDQAQSFAKRRVEAVAFAKESLFRAQQTYKRKADKSRRAIDWNVGDYVYVKKGNWATDRPHDGLDNPYLGPYKVLSNPYDNAYEIDFPPSMKIRRIRNASQLLRARDDPVPGQRISPPEPVIINGEQEWTVQKVISSRLYFKKLQYKVDWLGHDPDPTWYYASNFRNAPARLKEFHDRHPDAPGPPARLTEWLAAAADDRDAESSVEDDLPIMERRSHTGLRRRRLAH